MAHHSNEELEKRFGMEVEDKLGATGKFPQGKLVNHDEGEIKFAVGVKDRKVIIEFGTSVKWMGMDRSNRIS
jgi:hypothetical protein